MDGQARARRNRRLLRAIGLAGLAGVAATGAVIARAERQRRAVTPNEVRERLHARLADAARNGGHAQADPDRAETP